MSIEDLDTRGVGGDAMGGTVTNRKTIGLSKESAGSLRGRIDAVVEDIISDLPGGPDRQSARHFARKELLKLYDNPKVPQLEATLLKRITENEARHILFLPDHDQAKYYQALIADPPEGAPPKHPQHSLQIPHLSLLYLQHWKRWDFVSSFVLAGGLHTLCSLFTHANLVVRMKAITTLISITAHRDFDWFTSPPRARNVSTRGEAAGGSIYANNTTEARLHRALLGLRLDPAFIPGLIANSWGGRGGGKDATEDEVVEDCEKEGERGGKVEGETFPGACLMCLELLAMWLSWVRALHTVDGTLRLSRPLFRAIREWGGKDGDRQEGHRTGQGPWLSALQGKRGQPPPPTSGDAADEADSEGTVGQENGGGRSPSSGAVGAAAMTGWTDPTATTAEENGPTAISSLSDDTANTINPEGMDKEKEKDCATDRSGAGSGEEEGRDGEGERGKLAGTTTPSAFDSEGAIESHGGHADKGAPAEDDDAEKITFVVARSEGEERAKVLELAEKLVADFGRFPPAEQEWEGVNEGSSRGDGEPLPTRGNEAAPVGSIASSEEGKSAGQGFGEACSSTDDSFGSDGAPSGSTSGSKDSSRNSKSALAHGEKDPSRGSPRSETAEPAGDTSPPSAASAERALELKVEGNDSFRQGDLQAAKDAYTTALGVLDGGVAGDGGQKKRTTETSETCEAEANVLRGVLHRNRAVVALRLFEAAAAAAATAVAARNNKYKTTNNQESKSKARGVRTGARDSSNGSSAGGRAASGGIDCHSKQRTSAASAAEPASKNGDGGLPSSHPEAGRRSEETAGDGRAALESSLALLDECESDCLKAMEVDAGDKKARLRLDRCRELRRRCCRTGLAAATKGEAGCSTGYSRQDERLQVRKADLVAKILARGTGCHEVLGGPGAGRKEATHATLAASNRQIVPTADKESINHGCAPLVSSDGGDSILASDGRAEARSLLGVDGGSAGGRADRVRSWMVGKEKGRGASSVPDQEGAGLAPREGGELRAEVARSSWEGTAPKAGPTAPPISAAPTAGKYEHHEEVSSAPAVMPWQSTGRGGAASINGIVERRQKTAASKKNKKRGNKHDAEALRSLRGRLERAAARAAVAAAAAVAASLSRGRARADREKRGEEEDREEAAAKEVWDVLQDTSLPSDDDGGDGAVSLKRLFGDGITAESVAGIALGLRHACRAGAATSTERASRLFSELARVRRVRLALDMCSAKERGSLQDVWNHTLHRYHGNPDPRFQPANDGRVEQAVEGKGGGGKQKVEEEWREESLRRVELEDAASALGLL